MRVSIPIPLSFRMVSFSASFCWLGCSTPRDMLPLSVIQIYARRKTILCSVFHLNIIARMF
uniref:Uncharacterized protein n=1 Tax=Anguilla anguilla TaxID=7936 RepID=A0A0E9VV24_ANGAN